jgi:hypothetical protein
MNLLGGGIITYIILEKIIKLTYKRSLNSKQISLVYFTGKYMGEIGGYKLILEKTRTRSCQGKFDMLCMTRCISLRDNQEKIIKDTAISLRCEAATARCRISNVCLRGWPPCSKIPMLLPTTRWKFCTLR